MKLNLNNKGVKNIICAEKLTLKEGHNSSECATNYQSPQECVEENNKIVKKYWSITSSNIL